MVQDIKVGDKLRIVNMKYNPSIKGDKEACEAHKVKEGRVTMIDSIGQMHGTWGGLAVIPDEDEFVKVQ